MAIILQEAEKKKYASINGLRAISIMLVVFYHIEQTRHILSNASIYKPIKLFLLLFTDGKLGVNIFFVISGFLITSLLLDEEAKTKRISLKNFYIRRTIRIFPAYYFYLFVLFVLQIAGVIFISNPSWLTAVTYTKYFNFGLDNYTGHAWSLSIEEQFYLIFPILFMLGDKTRKIGAFFIILIVPIIKGYTYYYPISWINPFTLFGRMDVLAIGCLFAFYKETLLQILNKYFELLFYCCILTIFILEYLPGILEKCNIQIDFVLILFGSRYGTIANICLALVLLYSIYGHKGVWFRLLNTKILDRIGILSYSIYIWQQIFTKCLVTTPLLLNLILIILCSLFSYYCIEKPFLKLKIKFQHSK